MALLKGNRSAQYPLVAEFAFNYNDTMVDINGATKTFGSAFGDGSIFEVIGLPVGAVIIGGEVIVETAWAGSTAATVTVGTSADRDKLTNDTTVDLKTAGKTLLTLTGVISMVANDGKNVSMTTAFTVANATAGKARIRVMYTMDGRANEVIYA